MRYDVSFKVGETTRTIRIERNSTSKVTNERANAMVAATIQLDNEGIEDWTFLSCLPVPG